MSLFIPSRRRFIESLAFLPLVGCASRAVDTQGEDSAELMSAFQGYGVPTADELKNDCHAARRYERILRKLFRKAGATELSGGRPKNFEDIEQVVSDTLPSANGVVGHYAYTVPGDSIEHIKHAAMFWEREFGIGPFFAIAASNGKQDYFPMKVTRDQAEDLLKVGQRVPREDETGKQNLQWPVIAAVCKAQPNFYVEFNCQVLNVDSTFRDMYPTVNDGGLHHFAVITSQFAADQQTLMSQGFQPSSNLLTSVGVNYFDARHTNAGAMFELLETNVFLNFLFDSVYATCKDGGAKEQATYQSQIDSNLFKADVTTAMGQRDFTVPYLSTLIDWAATEGPLRNSDPRAAAYRNYVKAQTGKDLIPLP